MESFSIIVRLGGKDRELLVIPDDCSDKSVFHLVAEGTEFGKVLYTDSKNWEIIEGPKMTSGELQEIGEGIEKEYL